MNRDLANLAALASQVSDIYAMRHGIERNDDWHVLKLQEELGELTAEWLRCTGRGRPKGGADDAEAVRVALENEAADLLATLLVFACHNNIDLDAALERKWFKYLPSSD